MDREPFAKPYKDEDIVAIVVGDGSFGPHFDKEGSIRIASFLSVAHEARVKEAEKAAIAWAQHQCGCAKCVNPPI